MTHTAYRVERSSVWPPTKNSWHLVEAGFLSEEQARESVRSYAAEMYWERHRIVCTTTEIRIAEI